ncbi:MAG: phosphoribosylaminoimidazolesuccinocarboxamide synthase [Nitrospirae bacterium]|nr:phosphoribosylaminoimidazolesuccinocarboxamide synthase [Candidatus Manganitrophaceae bacterium]
MRHSKIPKEVLLESHLPDLKLLFRGKVRDIYDLGETLLFVATDRVSAFDVILPEGIPGKGHVLTQFSVYWFKWLSGIPDAPETHLIASDFDGFPAICQPYRDILEGRSLIVKKAKPILVECVVRGYLSGSGWKEYLKLGSVSGEQLPLGLRESDRLPEVIFTPSTKAEVGEHDMNISFEQMKSQLGATLSEKLRTMSVSIYKKAAEAALARGIIIADTKMEFGLDPETNEPILIDELLTPDSSRFWPLSDYLPGSSQPSFDKQYVRDYLLSINWSGDGSPPHLPELVVKRTSERYFEALRRLTD